MADVNSEAEMRSLGRQGASAAKAGKPQPAGWIAQQLKDAFDRGLQRAGLEHIDIRRITCHEGSSEHSDREIEEMLAALEWAKKSGRARFTGISWHDRPHIKRLIEKFPRQLECGPGRGGAARVRRGGEGGVGACHGAGLGQLAQPLPVAEGLGIRLRANSDATLNDPRCRKEKS
jgi:hypothetical protein